MPGMKTQVIHGGNPTWLGSMHGVENSRTAVLDMAKFTPATHYPNGYLPSGLPLAKQTNGTYEPYASGKTLAGFLTWERSVNGDPKQVVPLLDHGRVIVAKLPVSFTAPAADKNATNIIFI